MDTFQRVIEEVARERERQDLKWGPEHDAGHTFSDWVDILYAELFEAITAAGSKEQSTNEALTEIIHVAAVAVACLEHYGMPDAIVAVGHAPL